MPAEIRNSKSDTAPARLVVFSDDWGRHPSSCQHLVRHLLPRYPTLWVNTIGTRLPRLSRDDARKVLVKLRQWATASGGSPDGPGRCSSSNLSIVTPVMFPGFRRRWQRDLNRRLITGKLHRAMGPRRTGETRIAITTIPISADLVGALEVDRWVYYCVDDFGQWPGLDGATLEGLDRALIAKADRIVCVSETLRQRVAALGREAALLTHGIDLAPWQTSPAPTLPSWWPRGKPVYLFWGLVDRRLDTSWCSALAREGGTLVLAGPQQSPDDALRRDPNIVMPGPLAYEELPGLAAAADVLVMPYADLPVTRAMQPLKFKEYLATGKPVVARALPALADWADAADLVDTSEAFVTRCAARATDDLPGAQRQARQRLADESWASKAARFEQLIGAAGCNDE